MQQEARERDGICRFRNIQWYRILSLVVCRKTRRKQEMFEVGIWKAFKGC
jgi:hypothetical protein